MSFAKLYDQMRAAFDQKAEQKSPKRSILKNSFDVLSEASDRTQKRSKRIKEEKTRGIRGTRHRISL